LLATRSSPPPALPPDSAAFRADPAPGALSVSSRNTTDKLPLRVFVCMADNRRDNVGVGPWRRVVLAGCRQSAPHCRCSANLPASVGFLGAAASAPTSTNRPCQSGSALRRLSPMQFLSGPSWRWCGRPQGAVASTPASTNRPRQSGSARRGLSPMQLPRRSGCRGSAEKGLQFAF